MINIIKMDLYRMFRTKSLYVIWIIMAVAIVFTTFLAKTEYDMAQEKGGYYTEEQGFNEELEVLEAEEENVNIGMTVVLPTLPGEKITLFDCVFANIQGKFFALFWVIFTVIFSTADMTSGYIKTIGGQVKNRQKLILSKAVVLMFYVVLSVVSAVVIQGLSNVCILGYLELGNIRDFVSYLMVEIILHIALALISMAIAIVVRNNLFSMILVVCLCTNLIQLLYIGIDLILEKLGMKNFSIIDYTVTGKISALPAAPNIQEIVSSIMVALIFGAVLTGVAGVVFQRRDI